MAGPLVSKGVHVTGRAIAALLAAGLLLGAGIRIGLLIADREGRLGSLEAQAVGLSRGAQDREHRLALAEANMDILDRRLCRIERALHIEPWETCRPVRPAARAGTFGLRGPVALLSRGGGGEP